MPIALQGNGESGFEFVAREGVYLDTVPELDLNGTSCLVCVNQYESALLVYSKSEYEELISSHYSVEGKHWYLVDQSKIASILTTSQKKTLSESRRNQDAKTTEKVPTAKDEIKTSCKASTKS